MSIHDYARVERAIRFVQAHRQLQPDLAAVARHVGLSRYHFERMFARWAGTTPKRFLQYLTLDHAKAALRDAEPVLGAAFASGLSGSGRLHDLFVAVDGVTPGEFKRAGTGLRIATGLHETPFGRVLIGVTARGVCALDFVDDDGASARAALVAAWPEARVDDDETETAPYAARIMAAMVGDPAAPLPVLLRGTNLQLKVWEALLTIPAGEVVAYDEVAARVGRPEAVRAVAGAVARNPVGWLIPCHRVLRKSGALSGYRWGPVRKAALLAWEAARAEARVAA